MLPVRSLPRPFLRRATRTTVAVLAVAGAALVPSTLAVSATAVPSGSVAPCDPHQLTGPAGTDGGGEIAWITDTGLYVGAADGVDGVEHAGWWTHTGPDLDAGWTYHAVPGLEHVFSFVLDANDSGAMVGYDYDEGMGFVFDSRSAVLTWLPDLVGGHNVLYSRRINASGEVAGGAADRHGHEIATVWFPPYTTATRLPDAGGSQAAGTQVYKNAKMFAEADGINDAGEAAGITALGGPVANESEFARAHQLRGGIAPLFQAIIWHNPGVERLPAGEAQGIGFAINNADTVVGESDRPGDPEYNRYPAYWRNGQEHDMGAGPDAVDGRSYGISQGGWAAGQVDRADGSSRAFVWTGSGALQELEPLPGSDSSSSHAADDRLGQVGGGSWTGDGTFRPTLWQCPSGFTTG